MGREGNKVKTKTILRALSAMCVSAVLTISTAFAQAPVPYHPGETLTFTVAFDGPDIAKLTGAQLYFRLSGALHPDQHGFTTQLSFNQSKTIRPGSFEVSLTIPDNAASGSYKLFQANTGTPDVGWSYQDNLPSLTIEVDNSTHLAMPTLKGITQDPRP